PTLHSPKAVATRASLYRAPCTARSRVARRRKHRSISLPQVPGSQRAAMPAPSATTCLSFSMRRALRRSRHCCPVRHLSRSKVDCTQRELLRSSREGRVETSTSTEADCESGQVTVADGNGEIGELLYDNGHLTSQCAFTGITLDSVTALSGHALPFASTLSLNGNWSIAALPHLSGTFALRRAGGDVYAIQSDPARAPDLGIGIEMLEVAGTLHDDALDAKLVFRSARSGNADGTVSLGSV